MVDVKEKTGNSAQAEPKSRPETCMTGDSSGSFPQRRESFVKAGLPHPECLRRSPCWCLGRWRRRKFGRLNARSEATFVASTNA